MKKRFLMILLAGAAMFSSCARQDADQPAETPQSEEETSPKIQTDIYEFKKYGNIVLSVTPDELREAGFELADIIHVEIGPGAVDMPITAGYSEVGIGEPACVVKTSADGVERANLAVNGGNLVEYIKMGEIREIEEDPGYDLIFNEGFSAETPVYITMGEKQGYAEEYAMIQLAATRTNNREDYPDLSDEEYANFRFANTAGMGKDILARSSSPVNPVLNRSKEADQAVKDHGIRTILNMADNEEMMTTYEGYADTYSSTLDIIPLNMQMDFSADIFKDQFGRGMRFIIDHEGPYLIHCMEGKDRTGFAMALLEMLMGADMEEVTADYMVTYYNFYGIKPSDPQYQKIADLNLKVSLANAFHLTSLDGADLSACAEQYLRECGLSDEEITKLKEKLQG